MKRDPYADIYTAQPIAPTRKPGALPGSDELMWGVYKKFGTDKGKLLTTVGPYKTAYFARQAAATELHVEPCIIDVQLAGVREYLVCTTRPTPPTSSKPKSTTFDELE